MPARGSGAPPITRERPCRKCGGDEWRQRGNSRFACILCDRNRAREWASKQHRKDPIATMWKAAKGRAKRRGLPFTITIDDVRRAWPEDSRCPVLGIPLIHGTGNVQDGSATLDRMNQSWGYEVGNIAVISYAANRAKGNMRATDLERIVVWMRANGLD